MYEIYAARRPSPEGSPTPVPRRNTDRLWDPSGYIPGPDLARAVNIAITLNQPLLVSGEPGTGKTMLGYSIAWNLGLGTPLIFSAKSDTVGRDLYYHYDLLRHFHDAQMRHQAQNPFAYVMLRAIGIALVRTLSPDSVPAGLSSDHHGPSRSVVIVDEIDKASRDVPNDILWELERMAFAIPEVGMTIAGDRDFLPIVIFTSNSERSLPDAFVRRCIYHNIPFPGIEELAHIVRSRSELFSNKESKLLHDILRVFSAIRSDVTAMRKRPATAELLDWVGILEHAGVNPDRSLFEIPDWPALCVATLSKTAEDQITLRPVLETMRNGGRF